MLKTPRVSERQTLLEVMQSLSLLVVLVLVGCDKVETLVSDAKQEIAQQTGTVEQPAAQPSMPSPAAPIVTPPVATPEAPSPEKVLAEFKAIPPNQVADSALARLVAVPEAAAQVTEIDVSGSQNLTGAGLQHLAQLPNLKKLIMKSLTKLSGGDFSVFGSMSSLNELDITGGNLTVEHLVNVGKTPNLERLVIAGATVESAAVAQLAAAEKLSDFDASQTNTDDNAIAGFKNLPLRRVVLNQTRVTDASLVVLGGIASLEDLSLIECQVSGAGFLKPAFTNLKKLEVAKTRFGVEGLMAIKKLKKIERLGLFSTGIIFDNGSQVDPRTNVFKGFPELHELVVSGNSISNVGLATVIAGHKNLQILHLELSKGVGDPGLVRLVTCPKLTEIYATDTAVSAAGAKALKAKLPNVTITGPFGKI